LKLKEIKFVVELNLI